MEACLVMTYECPVVAEYKEIIRKYETLLEYITTNLLRIEKFISDYIKIYELEGETT